MKKKCKNDETIIILLQSQDKGQRAAETRITIRGEDKGRDSYIG